MRAPSVCSSLTRCRRSAPTTSPVSSAHRRLEASWCSRRRSCSTPSSSARPRPRANGRAPPRMRSARSACSRCARSPLRSRRGSGVAPSRRKGRMQVDAALTITNLDAVATAAPEIEAAGYDGIFSFEGQHDPFFPLLLAAEHTERVQLTTAVAIAFARNPMNLAQIAYDLQLASHGRFRLGLGTQIKPHIEKRFSMPWSSPVERMRELVLAIRAIWARWHEGTKLDFRGDFYRHTLMTPFFDPGPNPYGLPGIF